MRRWYAVTQIIDFNNPILRKVTKILLFQVEHYGIKMIITKYEIHNHK